MQLDIIAINYFGDRYYEDENTCVISGKRNDVQEDDFGRHFFLKMLSEGDYDGVFICQDLGIVTPIVEIMQHIKTERRKSNRKSFKSIFYFPVDCHLVDVLTKDLEFFDLLVTYTEFGRNEVLKFKPQLKGKLKVIPHGNNPKDFYPLPAAERLAFRKEFFGENADKFIIINVNRNQPRKDIPNTIFGFIEAKKAWDKALPEPFLYLHMFPNDPKGWDIRAIMLQTDLVEDVDYKLMPKEYEQSVGVEVDVLNKIYNACDVYLTTTLSEGWGLGYSESAACKLPIIAPFTTSFMEMSEYGKNAYMLKTIYPFCSPTDNIIREQTDIYEVADMILNVARDSVTDFPLLQGKVNRSHSWVTKLQWSEVCESWIKYFKELF